MRRFLIFTRTGRKPWSLHGEPESGLSEAIALATALAENGVDRVQVLEVGVVDACPSFTYRWGVRRIEGVPVNFESRPQ